MKQVVSFCVFAFAAIDPVLSASIPYSYGFGTRSLGMAGGGISSIEDLSAMYYNLSALTLPNKITADRNGNLIEGAEIQHRAMISFSFLAPLMYIDNAPGSSLANQNAAIASRLDSHALTHIAFDFDIRRLFPIPSQSPIKFGIGLSVSGTGKDLIDLSIASQRAYNFTNLGANAGKPEVMLGFSYQPWLNRLSVGLGTSISASAIGSVYVDEIDSGKPAVESNFDVKLKPSLMAGVTYLQPILEHTLHVAMTYKGASSLDADFDITAELPVSGLSVPATSNVSLLQYYRPEIISVSLTHTYDIFQTSLDAELHRWSGFGLSSTQALYENAPRFNDIVVLRGSFSSKLGLGFIDLWQLNFRTGYAYVPSYTPAQTGNSNYLDNDKHILGLGVFRKFESFWFIKRTFTIEASAQWQHWVSRSSNKTSRVTLPDNTLQPGYIYGGDLFLASLGVSVEF